MTSIDELEPSLEFLVAHGNVEAAENCVRAYVAQRVATGTDAPAAIRRYAAYLNDPERSRREFDEELSQELFRRLGPEGRIDDAYARLAELEQRAPTPETEAEIRATLSRLRELQHSEAKRMHEHFERNSSFDPEGARKALDDARKLIRKHARPS